MMKKYLLGVCLALSVQVSAYDGATVDFTTDFFSQAIAEGISQSLEDADMDKKECFIERLAPVINDVAERYVGQTLTKRERLLMDDFFDTPLGQAFYDELNFIGVREFGSGLDGSQYHQAEYAKYVDVMKKFFDEMQIPALFDGEIKDEMLISAVKCKMIQW